VVPALWMSPLTDPVRMLTLAFYWGVGFILLATLLTVVNRLTEGRYGEAVFGSKGVAGILFYLGLLYGGWRSVEAGAFGAVETAGIAIPFAFILGYQWHHYRAPVAERILVVFIEGFEVLISYFSNTLSFLRVAAFSLNHVALAIAIFAMANMMQATGHWITIVLGNVIILVLEGAIVAIQALRLEYYEGFSRFFGGDGREFRPLRLTVSGIKSPISS
jgi:V/A-type H+/Na+-transporting ATPase subunit I